jgi:hypothetical protein
MPRALGCLSTKGLFNRVCRYFSSTVWPCNQRPPRFLNRNAHVAREIRAYLPAKTRLTRAPSSLQSKIGSWVAVPLIVTVFLCSVERRFSVPAMRVGAVAHSLGQAWPQATGEAGAERA